ncbi:MAG: GC-type dockerin domain-anchored protein [Planctomycetota bacterium]
MRRLVTIVTGSLAALAQGQSLTETTKLIASDATANAAFGLDAAMSPSFYVIGAPRESEPDTFESGAAYVFDAITNQELFRLFVSDADGRGAGDNFGISVDVSEQFVIVGARLDDRAGLIDTGTAYVFDPTTGAQLLRLIPFRANNASEDFFGRTVAIDGTTAIVGAPGDELSSIADAGAAHVFDLTNGDHVFRLQASDLQAGAGFGWSSDIDEGIALIGAPDHDLPGAIGAGAVYTFDVLAPTVSGIVKEELRKFVSPAPLAGEQFGFSVAIDGHFAVIGAPQLDAPAGSNAGGVAYVFDVTTGHLMSTLASPDTTPGDWFGYSVGIDGTRVVVGALRKDQSSSNEGAAYLFDALTGEQTTELIASDGGSEEFLGYGASVQDDTVLVGARWDSLGTGLADAGSAYVFVLADCDDNGQSDIVQIDELPELDCNQDGLLDSCQIADAPLLDGRSTLDFNNNGTLDACELDALNDCDGDGVIDALQLSIDPGLDEDLDGSFDACQINTAGGIDGTGGSLDCDADGRLDPVQIALAPVVDNSSSLDFDDNGILDTCELDAINDCDANGELDALQIAVAPTFAGSSVIDFNDNGILDDCEINSSNDCDNNDEIDALQLAMTPDLDGDMDGVFDACQINDAGGSDGVGGALDCNENGVIDAVEINRAAVLNGLSTLDFNNNGLLDSCELNAVNDCDADDVIDLLQAALAPELDCDADGKLDQCELVSDPIAFYAFNDGLASSVPGAPPLSVLIRDNSAGPIGLANGSWSWNEGTGLELDTNTLSIGDEWSIGIRFSFTDVDDRWVRVVDTQAGSTDFGWYNSRFGNELEYYNCGGGLQQFGSREAVDVFIVYADGIASGYLNGVNSDDSSLCPPSTASFAGLSSEGLFRFFYDDGTTENSSGSVDSIALWNRALPPSELPSLGGVIDVVFSCCGTADLAAPFGVLDLDDLDTFVSAFLAGEPLADTAAPTGVIDLADIDAFITAFLTGCH